MNIEYAGEWLWPGQVGHFLLILSFAASLVSVMAFYKAHRSGKNDWLLTARTLYYLQSAGVMGSIAVLLFLLLKQRYEYHYVWQHTAKDLPLRYLLSAFWEGQEGSFLLWLFWQTIIGGIMLFSPLKHSSSIFFFYMMIQSFLLSMLLGIEIGEVKIGSDPFILLRNHPDFAHLPFTKNPHYLQQIEPRGLNPLLQNYWMVIHPPMLFCGFASMSVPFVMALSALLRKDYLSWIKTALPWTYLAIATLGLGILLGGAWAYEALSFGGFWAWDPVENSSLVPWIMIVAAGHLMFIAQKSKKNTASLFIFTLLSYWLVLYSTYLTRSGILGESSVHSFAEGLPGQLIALLAFFFLLSLFLLVRSGILQNRNNEPSNEPILSREFWLFTGSIILALSAFQIILSTSIPVINKIFSTQLSPPNDAAAHYNSWQTPFAIFILLAIAITQYLKFGPNQLRHVLKQIALPAALAVLPLTLAFFFHRFSRPLLWVLLYTGWFAFLVNILLAIKIFRSHWLKSGKFIAHAGFAFIVVGATYSMGLKKNISVNTSGIDIRMKGEKENANLSNILLLKHDTLPMGEYWVTFQRTQYIPPYLYYQIRYLKKNEKGTFTHQFDLYPKILLNKKMGNVAEPSTHHFWHKDLFTHITYADLSAATQQENISSYSTDTFYLQLHDTVFTSQSFIILESLTRIPSQELTQIANFLHDSDLVVKATLKVYDLKNAQYTAEPLLGVHRWQLITFNDTIKEKNMIFTFANINPDKGKIAIIIQEPQHSGSQFVVMQAIEFPLINLLWIGCILMVAGSVISVIKRFQYAFQN